MLTEDACLTDVLADLDEIAPGVPLLALGQTVFWDEPMKAGIALALRRSGSPRRFLAGVHDTDYFAKLPSGQRQPGRFRAFPHNDGSTRGLWSAAGEFSVLLGSETVVGRDILAAAGLRVARVQEARPGFLDEATEAWGWRGIVSLDEHPPVTADVPLRQILPELRATFQWALDRSVETLGGAMRQHARQAADHILAAFDEQAGRAETVAEFYERLLPAFFEFASTFPVDLDTTRTTRLLRFNRETCSLPRFGLLSLFVDETTRAEACRAYDDAIEEAPGLYGLSRFGTGAIPFDLVIPGVGRGTIRLGRRGAVIMTHQPRFLSFKRPLRSLEEFAALVEDKFGPDCVVVGKAVALIGLLAREHVFVFHYGASSYVKYSRGFHRLLKERLGVDLGLKPILRARYDTWDALGMCCSWLRLPEPFVGPFGTEETCAPSFASRWREVAAEQESLLARLGELKRPIELIQYLDETQGGAWQALARDYNGLHARLDTLARDLDEVHRRRVALYARIRSLKQARLDAERTLGDHFRARIFEKDPTPEDLAERTRLQNAVAGLIHDRAVAEAEMRHLRKEQNALLKDDQVTRVHERRRSIELEAELKRLRLIRHAVAASRGLKNANRRPSAWWFRLVCPDGLWFRATTESARYWLEPLI